MACPCRHSPAGSGRRFFEEFPHAGDLIADGLLTQTEAEVKLTAQGLLIADSVFATFF